MIALLICHIDDVACQQPCDDLVFFSSWPCSCCTPRGGCPCQRHKQHLGVPTRARGMASATRPVARPPTSVRASTGSGPMRTSPSTRPRIAPCEPARTVADGLTLRRRRRRRTATPSARELEIATVHLACACAQLGLRGKPATYRRARGDALVMVGA